MTFFQRKYNEPRSSWLLPNTLSLSLDCLDTGTRVAQSKQRLSVWQKYLILKLARACVLPYHPFVISYWSLLKQSRFCRRYFRRRKATGGESVCFRRLTSAWLSRDFSPRTCFIDNSQNFRLSWQVLGSLVTLARERVSQTIAKTSGCPDSLATLAK